MNTGYENEVGCGMCFLDANAEGWLERINVETLAFDHTHACPLGQVFGNIFQMDKFYGLQASTSNQSPTPMQQYGFAPNVMKNEEFTKGGHGDGRLWLSEWDAQAAKLLTEWKHRIIERKMISASRTTKVHK